MNHDTEGTINTVVSGDGRVCIRVSDTAVLEMSAGRCECQDPGCSNHLSGEYKCAELSKGMLTNEDGYSMELCPGCAVSEMTGLELGSVTWELFELPTVTA